MRALLVSVLILPLLSGCIARAVVGVATAPVKVGAKAVDMATTSQSEADEKRGRAIRKCEERLGKMARQRDKLSRACRKDGEACDDLRKLDDEMDDARSCGAGR